VASDGHEYEDVLRRADAEAAEGRYKEAYNLLGGGPWGTDGDRELRYKRGLYAFNVARERLSEFQGAPSRKLTLVKAGCWLARSEAYLSSAAEEGDEETRRQVAGDIERTMREQERFRALAQGFDEALFVTNRDARGET